MIRRLAGIVAALLLLAGAGNAGLANGQATDGQASGGQASGGRVVVVRPGEHAGFGRLVFDWPRATSYAAEIVDGELVVSFPDPTRFDLSPLSRDLEDYIGRSRVGADGKSVHIPLKAGFTMKHYALGPKVVIDLIDPPGGLKRSDAASHAAPHAAPHAASHAAPHAPAGAPATAESAAPAGAEADGKAADSPAKAAEGAAEAPAAVPEAPGDPGQPARPSGPKVLVRVGEHPGFSRLVFDWPASVPYRVEEAPGRATLWFGRPAELDLSRYRKDPPERVSALVQRAVAEGLAVELAVPSGAKLRHYTDGPLVVVDVVAEAAPARATAESASEPPAAEPTQSVAKAPDAPAAAQAGPKPSEPSEAAMAAQPAESKPMPAQSLATAAADGPPTQLLPESLTRREAAPAPEASAAPGEAKAAADMAGDRSGGKEGPTPPSEPKGESRAAADEAAPADSASAAPAEAPAASDAAPTSTASEQAGSDTAAEAAGELVSANPAPSGETAEAAEAGLTVAADVPVPGRSLLLQRPLALRFNWAEPVGAAAFLYGGRLWLVFDRPVRANIAAKITTAAPRLAPVDQLPNAAATVLRLNLPTGFSARLRNEEADWLVDLRQHDSDMAHSLSAAIDSSAKQTRLRVPLEAPGHVIKVTDPDLGTPLQVVTIKTPELGLARQYSLPELRLLPTYQGLAVEPRADSVTVTLDEQGAVIAAADGLNASAVAIRETQHGNVLGLDSNRRLLDLEGWRGAEPFLTRKQELQNAVVAADPKDQDLARLNLARFYFAYGLASEALGALELIERGASRLAADPQLILLKGASEFLNDEYEAAAKSLQHPALDGERDARLWRGALAAVGGDWPTAARLLSEAEPLIESYAAPVRNRLWLLAAEAELEHADGAAAQHYLDLVRRNHPTVFDQARVDYLEGRRLASDGEAELAKELWQAVANSGNGAASAQARLTLIDQGLKEGTLSLADAILELEHLQFAWRGDSFEFALLQRLGELYLEQNRYRDALLAMRQAASYLPDAARSKAITQRMREVFADLFLSEAGQAVPPVAALGIYREFRELTPSGERGDALISNLAKRLVEVDLLAQAAELLQTQVDHRLQGPDKAATGDRIAMLYLLDRQPQRALEALRKSETPDLPDQLVEERRTLQARALADLGKSDEALALLDGDQSDEAQRLRAQVYWSERRWPEAAAALEALLPKEPPLEGSLSDENAQLVASLAVAYTLDGDRGRLADLDWRYGDVMRGTAQAEAFAMLTGDLESGAIPSIADELAGVETIQAFMTDYRKRLAETDQPTLN